MPDDLLALQDEYISVDAEITRLEERKKQLQSYAGAYANTRPEESGE